MGLSTLIKQLYLQTIGGSAPSGAASSSGDISQMVKYLTANISLVPNAVEVYPKNATTLGFSGTGAWSTRAGPAASSQASAATANTMAFHPNGAFVAAALNASPYVAVWNFSDSGYGSKLSDPATLPAGSAFGVAWHPNGNWLAVAHSTSPYITVYAFDKVGAAIGAKVSNPASLPSGANGRCVTFSPDGNYLAVGNNSGTAAAVEVYAFNSSTGAIGAKVSNPGTAITGLPNGLTWSQSGAYLAVAHDTSPFITVYPWSAGFGTKLSDPGTLPTSNGRSIAWRGDDLLILGEASSPYIHAWAFSSAGFGTKWSNPGALPAGSLTAVAITPLGNYVVAAGTTSPYLTSYPLGATAFGTKLSDPGSTPGAAAYGVAARPGAGTLYIVAGANNAGNSHYSWLFTQVGYTWTPVLTTIGLWAITVATSTVRVRPVISGVVSDAFLLPSGNTFNFQTDVDSVFIGPDVDGGTGTFKVVASGR